MNKQLIALAVAAAMPMAAVHAAPTVYGIGQVEINNVDNGTTDSQQMSDNGTGRFGVKGSEDLGGGLKAVYNMEWGVDTSDNRAGDDVGEPFKERTSMIGLAGSFGEVTFGRQTSPFGRVNLDSGYNATVLQARGNVAQIGSTSYGNGSFASETINYKGKFGPVTFRAMISANDAIGNDGDNAISADFKQGPLRIVAAVSNDETSATVDVERSKLGAQYKLGAWKFTAQVENQDTTNGADIDYTMLMADFTMGKNVITARLGNQESTGVDLDHTMVAIKHNLSKKTSVWAGVASTDTSATTETDVTSIGMRVKF